MTAKQRRFVEEYLIDHNATQAAIRAGYSENGAKSAGSRLLANVNVGPAVEKAIAERSGRTGITQDYVLNGLKENADRAMQAIEVFDKEGNATGEWVWNGNVANQAFKLLGDALGMFKTGITIETPGGVLIAPLASSPDEWETIARRQQAQLVNGGGGG